jgi:hypothetical protein
MSRAPSNTVTPFALLCVSTRDEPTAIAHTTVTMSRQDGVIFARDIKASSLRN